MGYRLKGLLDDTTASGPNHASGCWVVELVTSSRSGVPQGCMQGVVLNGSELGGAFSSSIPDLGRIWQCRPMGKGLVRTSRSSK